MNYSNYNPAFVFGMFETGLAVSRSLGRYGINVFGFDHKKDIGFYSKYINAELCPHPLIDDQELLKRLISKSKLFESKPVIFVTSDDFLEFFINNRIYLEDYFLLNINSGNFLDLSLSKNKFYSAIASSGIPLPRVYETKDIDTNNVKYPVLIKGDNVNIWRKNVNSATKVIIANNSTELDLVTKNLNSQNINFVIQEIIPGNDECFYKYCAYRTKDGRITHEFMLRKLRQNPIRFGVGSLVISCVNEELRELGRRLFECLDYKGIGSAEFKFDSRDAKFKLIELNSRYWQQNGLSERCGINFPLIEYLYLTGQSLSDYQNNYETGIKWLNIYMDFSSFLEYRKENKITLFDWIEQIKGKKVFSDFSSDDILPSFYEIFISNKIKKIPSYLKKTLIND